MKNKIVIAILLIAIGFLSGAVTVYFWKRLLPQKFSVSDSEKPVSVSGGIVETNRSFSEIARGISPSVVNISTTKVLGKDAKALTGDQVFDSTNPYRDFRMPKKWKEQSLGSGVIISKDGYVITNSHVIEQADEILITLDDQRSLQGKVIGTDAQTDIAVLKIDVENLREVEWRDSDKLQVGEFVLAVGNPYGLDHTVTMGIISAIGRAGVGITDYEDFIQTDAAINPGNSGGPLVDIQGRLVGINTAIYSRSGGYQGIGFAVPSNMVRVVVDQLVRNGKIVRGWIGITIQELTSSLSDKLGLQNQRGVLVSDIDPGGPAEKSGIKRGDIILSFNGKKIKDVGSFRSMVAQSAVGSEVSFDILRDGRQFTALVKIIELPKDSSEKYAGLPSAQRSGELTGLTVRDISKEMARQLGVHGSETGVVVVVVEEGSPAAECGIIKGDIILEINEKKIKGSEEFYSTISSVPLGDTALLFINRGGKKFYVTLRTS